MKRWMVLAAVLALGACARGRPEEAEQAVRTYLARLVEAYRTSDASLVDPLVSDEQGLKLIGLIGVKRDAGVVLDAKVLELQFVRTARQGERWVVETRERWYYKDRKIGTGEQVGDESTDSYVMRYVFSRKEGRYVLDELSFVEPPVVSRKTAPLPIDQRVMHGLPPDGEKAAAPRVGALPAPPARTSP